MSSVTDELGIIPGNDRRRDEIRPGMVLNVSRSLDMEGIPGREVDNGWRCPSEKFEACYP